MSRPADHREAAAPVVDGAPRSEVRIVREALAEGCSSYDLVPGRRILVGRSGDLTDLTFRQRCAPVSRIHLIVAMLGGGEIVAFDLRTRNGTFRDGVRIQDVVTLTDGDVLSLGAEGVRSGGER